MIEDSCGHFNISVGLYTYISFFNKLMFNLKTYFIAEMRSDRTDTSHTEMDANGKPKPPPRRQNPFNRPAPPPPDAPPGVHGGVSLRGGVVMSPMPFIPGYFGSSNAKAQQEQQRLGK